MKLLKHTKTIHTLKNDPLGFVIDSIVRMIVNIFIPIPLAGDTVMLFKGPVLGCLATLIMLGLFLIIITGTVLITPFLASEGFLKKITAPFISPTSSIPSDSSFIQTSTPMQIPLGGKGLDYASITAGFMDPSYFLKFGMNHTGIDLVPNENYYRESQPYKQTKRVIVYSTISGKVTYYIDSYGSETVEVIPADGTLKTIYMHMKEVFVQTGDTVNAGSPLGEMGKTGFATAEHVHYEIRVKSGSNWTPVNPLTYIK